MRGLARPVAAAVLCICSASHALEPVRGPDLCVTSGAVTQDERHQMGVRTPEMRAVVRRPPGQVAELRFTYLGHTLRASRLASGEIRHQFGLKLKARDSCNVVYAMWHFDPKPGLAVSVKSNPRKQTHAECGAHGYHNVAPTVHQPVPSPAEGSAHVLRAVVDRSLLSLWADGVLAWQGPLPPLAFTFEGPMGVRSDNVELEFQLFTDPAPANAALPPCPSEKGGPD